MNPSAPAAPALGNFERQENEISARQAALEAEHLRTLAAVKLQRDQLNATRRPLHILCDERRAILLKLANGEKVRPLHLADLEQGKKLVRDHHDAGAIVTPLLTPWQHTINAQFVLQVHDEHAASLRAELPALEQKITEYAAQHNLAEILPDDMRA